MLDPKQDDLDVVESDIHDHGNPYSVEAKKLYHGNVKERKNKFYF